MKVLRFIGSSLRQHCRYMADPVRRGGILLIGNGRKTSFDKEKEKWYPDIAAASLATALLIL